MNHPFFHHFLLYLFRPLKFMLASIRLHNKDKGVNKNNFNI